MNQDRDATPAEDARHDALMQQGLVSEPVKPWEGAPGNEEWHRTTGRRAWSMPEKVGLAGTNEWCYPDNWCEGCRYEAGQMPVWLPGDKSIRHLLAAGLAKETSLFGQDVKRVLDALWEMRR